MKKWISLALIITSLASNEAWSLQASLQTKIYTWKTTSDIPVYYMPTHEIPIVDVAIVFDAGSARDGTKHGLASLTQALLKSGTKKHSVEEIAEGFDSVASQLNHRANVDMALISLRSLSEANKLQTGLMMMRDILSHPTFPEKEVKRLQTSSLRSIETRKQSPRIIADDAMYAKLYGQQPYGHPVIGEVETVQRITREDIVNFHRRFYVAKNAMVAIVGDIDKKEAQRIAHDMTQDLRSGRAAPPLLSMDHSTPETRRQHIAFPSTQTAIRFGTIGIKRSDKDYFPLQVGNHILGGAPLLSQLFEEIRMKRGLSYGAYSYFSATAAPGPFIVAMETRNAQAKTAEHVARQILEKFLKQGPSIREIRLAKQNLIGSFPLKLDSNYGRLINLIHIGFYHLPTDYLALYPRAIRQVRREEITGAFQRHISTRELETITVGKRGVTGETT